MFVFSVKTTRYQLIWAVVCTVLLAAIVLALSVSPATADAAATVKAVTVASAQDGVAYLKTLGYTATAGDVREITVPQKMDAILTAYNTVQKAAGFDLKPYLGKKVMCYTLTVDDYQGAPATAHIFTFENRVVGGDITPAGSGSLPSPLTVKK